MTDLTLHRLSEQATALSRAAAEVYWQRAPRENEIRRLNAAVAEMERAIAVYRHEERAAAVGMAEVPS